MNDTDYSVEGEVSSIPPSTNKCSICGKLLSRYNKTGRCFHHPDPEKERRQEERDARREAATIIGRALPAIPESTEASAGNTVAGDVERKEPLTPERIMTLVCDLFGMSREEVESGGRQAAIARARHVLMYLLYSDTHLSYQAIGGRLGGRDHTTVIHGVSKINEELETDSELQELIRYLRSQYDPPPVKR
jgi:hypothetical protein